MTRNVIALIPILLVGGLAHTQQQSGSAPSQPAKKQSRSAGGEVGSGTGDIGKGAGKGAGNLAVGAGKGAADLVTLNPVGAAAEVGKGGASAGKNIAVGTGKGSAKIAKGAGRAVKKIL